MATATLERRYSLTMTHQEAQTLLAVLGNIYVNEPHGDPREDSRYQHDIDAIIHLHEVLARAGGLSNEYELPLVAGD